MLLALTLLLACDSALDDPDGDFLNASEELVAGTDPSNPDMDGDGLLDGVEVLCLRTDPTSADHDGDGDDDAWEVARGLDPHDEGEHGYPDGHPMLTVDEVKQLRLDTAPDVASLGLPLRDVRPTDPVRGRFRLVDLASQGKPILLAAVPHAAQGDLSAALQRGEHPGGPQVAAAVQAGKVTFAWLMWEDADGRAYTSMSEPLAVADANPTARVFVDRGFELWGHLGRPSETLWLLLDERMTVVAVDDWAAIRGMLP